MLTLSKIEDKDILFLSDYYFFNLPKLEEPIETTKETLRVTGASIWQKPVVWIRNKWLNQVEVDYLTTIGKSFKDVVYVSINYGLLDPTGYTHFYPVNLCIDGYEITFYFKK